MSTDIKLTADLGGDNNGDVITVTDGVAAQLIENEYAEATESKPKRGRAKASDAQDPAPKTGVAGNFSQDPSKSAPPTSGFNLGMGDFFVFFGTAAAVWTLPTVGNAAAGAELTVKNRESAVLTINSNASGNDISGTAAVPSVTVAAGASLHLICDGTYWNVV